MRKNYSAQSKILFSMVFGIAVYSFVYFVVILTLGEYTDSLPYKGHFVQAAATLMSGIFSFLTFKTAERKETLKDKKAFFADKPYFLPIVIVTAFAMTVSFNFLLSLFPWDVFNSTENIVQNNESFYSIPLSFRLLTYVIITPLSEEILFRGIIFKRFDSILSLWGSTLAAAAIFGIYHGNLQQGIYAFVNGIVMCLIVHYGGSLFYSFVYHMIANLISNLCFEYEHINNVVYHPLSIILCMVYLVVAIILYYVIKNRLTKKDKEC